MEMCTELAPIYRTFPLSTTSFSARIISSRGVSRSSRWICSTSIYVPSRRTLLSTASRMCLRDSPTRFTHGPSLILLAAMSVCCCESCSSHTPVKHLVMMTTRLRGMLYLVRALPMMRSETPCEYMSAYNISQCLCVDKFFFWGWRVQCPTC